MKAIIVASGPSARGFVPPANIPVIAVNGAIEWLSRADHFFTLDGSSVNLHRLHNRRAGVQYHTALPKQEWFDDPEIFFYLRGEAKGPAPIKDNSPEWWLWRLSAKLGLSDNPRIINSGNSAYGALGLAYHLGAHDVALIGVDGSTEPRVEGGYSRYLGHLPLLFASALKQIRVVSCGQLHGIPRMCFQDWLHD
ncbi:hypothetical protein [Brucella sp. 2716]|uniref:hypothetical protein n=1 Tax=Brucella sp. 2716 TaxID=2975052 RepID=UPI00217D1F1C|nr:hypothetical protein [Brucella sp. 2716]UWF60332.1 hypothetical protein NYO66_15185 [Brucella sp. 2716]